MATIHVNGVEVVVQRIERAACGAKWLSGRVGKCRFDALVFAEHAENPEWEIAGSRISKLFVYDGDRKFRGMAYCWERGLDKPAESPEVQAVVDLVCGFAADRLWGKVGAA